MEKQQNPLAEIFGFSILNNDTTAKRYRKQKLCPFNNKSPNCTKDKANDPLGICSIYHKQSPVITCPVRFREDWLVIENAAHYAFGENVNWTSLSEIKLLDATGQSAGNVDFVIVSYDDRGKLLDFISLEIQGVYISGNLRNAFDKYILNPIPNFTWPSGYNYPKPDYLSSSRKRLIPQMLYKGGIFKYWGKKQAVALQKSFFDTLPDLPRVAKEESDIAWFLYDLVFDNTSNNYKLALIEIIYTQFEAALLKITNPTPSSMDNFIDLLQDKLDDRLDNNPPDAPTLNDAIIN